MATITFFTHDECTLCAAALFAVDRVRTRVPAELVIVNIRAPGNERWLAAYGAHIPVVHVDGSEVCRHRVEEAVLERWLRQRGDCADGA